MTEVNLLLTGFVCVWTWSEISKILKDLSDYTKIKWGLAFLPLAVSIIYWGLNWQWTVGLAFILFILQKTMNVQQIQKWKLIPFLCLLAMSSVTYQFFLQALLVPLKDPNPSFWLFLPGEMGLKGLVLGFVLGFLISFLFQEKGNCWWWVPASLFIGLGSLGFAWGGFLGDRWQWKSKTSNLLSLVGFGLGLILMSSYNPALKLGLWLTCCLVWICIEQLIFHRQLLKS